MVHGRKEGFIEGISWCRILEERVWDEVRQSGPSDIVGGLPGRAGMKTRGDSLRDGSSV